MERRKVMKRSFIVILFIAVFVTGYCADTQAYEPGKTYDKPTSKKSRISSCPRCSLGWSAMDGFLKQHQILLMSMMTLFSSSVRKTRAIWHRREWVLILKGGGDKGHVAGLPFLLLTQRIQILEIKSWRTTTLGYIPRNPALDFCGWVGWKKVVSVSWWWVTVWFTIRVVKNPLPNPMNFLQQMMAIVASLLNFEGLFQWPGILMRRPGCRLWIYSHASKSETHVSRYKNLMVFWRWWYSGWYRQVIAARIATWYGNWLVKKKC